jgi:hypothetical protein
MKVSICKVGRDVIIDNCKRRGDKPTLTRSHPTLTIARRRILWNKPFDKAERLVWVEGRCNAEAQGGCSPIRRPLPSMINAAAAHKRAPLAPLLPCFALSQRAKQPAEQQREMCIDIFRIKSRGESPPCINISARSLSAPLCSPHSNTAFAHAAPFFRLLWPGSREQVYALA